MLIQRFFFRSLFSYRSCRLLKRFMPMTFVATENLEGGSSCFRFCGSRKATQAHGAAEAKRFGTTGRVRSASRDSVQIASVAQKRRTAAIAVRKKAVAAADRKLALSHTLTVRAEGFLDNNQTDLAITNYRAALVQNPEKHAGIRGAQQCFDRERHRGCRRQ